MRRDWIEPILIAFILAAVIRVFIFQPFKIPSGSMEDTLLVGDQLIAVKFIYGLKMPFFQNPILKIRDPKPGDVIVFKFPQDPSKDFIKRLVAVGGQTVEIDDKKLYVNGLQQHLPKHAKFIDPAVLPEQFGPRDNYGPAKVPDGHVFVMGDNRDNSNDSRFWEYVPVENIKGKALLIYWSWNNEVPLYNIFKRIRWNRLLHPIR
ncbi:MAG: signal peptidase I [Candidatus Latescibacterota bacterium]